MKVSDEEISRGLSNIRRLRRAYLAILISYLPLLVLIMSYVESTGNYIVVLFPVGLFFIGILVQHRLQNSRCPRCRDFFFARPSKDRNYMPLIGGTTFPPQKRCQNCSLVLYY